MHQEASHTGLPILRFSVPAEASRLRRARDRVRDFVERHGVTADVADAVVLAVAEAAANVVRHGGSEAGMDIALRFEGRDLIMDVRDEGGGFPVEAIEPPVRPDPLDPGGRGLYLISQLVDEFELRVDGGAEVHMVKREARPDPSAAAPAARDAAHDRRYQESRQLALIDEMDEAFLAIDWDYRCTYANRAACTLARMTEEELLGRRIDEVLRHSSAGEVGEAIREAMDLGRPATAEALSGDGDGWVEVRLYPTSTGVSMYCTDITTRKRREAERDELMAALSRSRERESFLADVVERATVPFVVGAPDGRLLLFNQAFAELTGYRRQELEEGAVTWTTVLTPPDWREREAAALAEAVENRGPVRYEKEYVRRNGARVPVELLVEPVFDDRGDLAHYRGFVTDISERKESRAALRQSNERYRRVFASTSDGLALLEPVADQSGAVVDHRYVEANQAYGRLTGLDPEKIVGKTVTEALPESGRELAGLFRRVAACGVGEHFEAEATGLGGRYAGYAYPVEDRLLGVTCTDLPGRVDPSLDVGGVAQLGDEVRTTFDGPAPRVPLLQRLSSYAWLTILPVALGIIFLAAADPSGIWRPEPLYSVLSVAFLTVLPFAVALVAGNNHVARPSASVLLLGSGGLALGLGAALAAVNAGGNGLGAIPTVYNSAALLACACLFAGSLTAVFAAREHDAPRRGWPTLLAAYGAVIALVVLQTLLVRAGIWPIYFVEGSGQTALGRTVLYSAAALLGVAAVVLALAPGRRHSPFADWYGAGMGLLALGLISVSLQAALGDPMNWLGRGASYAGSLFMFLAVIVTVRESGSLGVHFERALRESQGRYRDLVETSPQAIVVHGGGTVLFANPAAVALFGADSEAGLVGRPVLSLFEATDRRFVASRIESTYDGDQTQLMGVRAARPDGAIVDLEGRQSKVEFGGRPALQMVLADVSARRRAEASLRTSRERATLLAKTASGLLAGDAPQQQVESLCQGIMEHLDCQAFFNFLADEHSGRLHLNACAGIPAEEAAAIEWLDYGQAVCGCAAQDSCRIVVEDVLNGDDPRTGLIRRYGIQAYACHPLRSRGHTLGTLSFGTRTRTRFADDELELMAAVADQVAIAIDRSRAYSAQVAAREQAQNELRTSRSLLDAAGALADRTDLGEMLQALAASLTEAVRHSRVAIALWDSAKRELRTVAMLGDASQIEPLPWRRLSTPTREAIVSRRTTVADFDAAPESERGHGDRTPGPPGPRRPGAARQQPAGPHLHRRTRRALGVLGSRRRGRGGRRRPDGGGRGERTSVRAAARHRDHASGAPHPPAARGRGCGPRTGEPARLRAGAHRRRLQLGDRPGRPARRRAHRRRLRQGHQGGGPDGDGEHRRRQLRHDRSRALLRPRQDRRPALAARGVRALRDGVLAGARHRDR